MTVKAYAVTKAKGDFEPFEFELGDIDPYEVDISVESCGICHSDLSMINNEWGFTAYPFVPGHEVAGTVAAVGEGTQAVLAPAIATVRSVPAGLVTRISRAERQARAAAKQAALSSSSGGIRPKISGCSFETVRTRAPPVRMALSSGACMSPSKVRSTTTSARERATTAPACPVSARAAPVERRIGPGGAAGGRQGGERRGRGWG